MPASFTLAAADDLDVAFAFVSERNRTAALELLAALREAVDRISEFPKIGTPLPPEEYGFVEPAAPSLPFVGILFT